MDPMLVLLEGAERRRHVELLAGDPRRKRSPRGGGPAPLRRPAELDAADPRRLLPALRDPRGQILAAVSLHESAWRLDARKLRVAQISDLVVRRDVRRLGLGSRLLRAVHRWAREGGMDASVVWSPFPAERFERFGYRELETRVLEADLAGWETARPRVASPPRVRPFRPSDFEAVRELYNAATSLQRLAVLRSDEDWRALLERPCSPLAEGPDRAASSFLVAERDGRVTSYLRAEANLTRGVVRVLEYAFEVGAREHLTALLRAHLAALPGSLVGSRLVGVVPSRFRNLCPSHRMRWRREERRLLMKSFGGFQVPVDCRADDRLVWSTDRH